MYVIHLARSTTVQEYAEWKTTEIRPVKNNLTINRLTPCLIRVTIFQCYLQYLNNIVGGKKS